MLTVAIYPGSFDPITNGHIDIATRASKLFERVIIAIFAIPDKRLFFSIEERVDLATRAVANLANVEVRPYSGLTVNFARQVKADVMVRGLRMSADFEGEFEMAMMNKKLSPALELVCFMASQEYQFLSSSLLKEAACLGGNINGLVPPHVAEALIKKCAEKMPGIKEIR
ncbi:MAG: pantetheine-phosphate adenylyltransferase [Chloroflexi bacterium RBG_16_50_9]|nr:MAG: pantetheine-phosphate adenylyltransferase [Chloroflexi bacterium RBG_16_50_9]